MDKRKKKCIIFLVVIVLLFILSNTAGFMREDDKMAAAMKKVKAKVNKARKDIQKEMDKPFILRLFGSLFGMEGNKFDKLKRDLPALIKDAMPTSVGKFGNSTEPSGVAVTSMRLTDALLELKEKKKTLSEIRWKLADKVSEEKYVALSGTVLDAEEMEDGKVVLTVQLWHPFNGENGLEQRDPVRHKKIPLAQQVMEDNLAQLRERAKKGESYALETWYAYEKTGKRDIAFTPALKAMQVHKAEDE